MKKFISVLILICFLTAHVTAFAEDDYITLVPYPYSTHVLGEDLVIYGDTNLSSLTLGFFYPEDQGYMGYAKFIMTISAKELKEGYVIKTDTFSRLWPEGKWTVRVQNGDAKDEMKITMTTDPVFDREVKLAEYEDNALINLTSIKVRGIIVKDNIVEFTKEDNTVVKIFSWNNLSPTDNGESKIYVTHFNDGYLTEVKTYDGTLTSYGNHISLDMDKGNSFKLFYWNDNLNPIS